MTGRTVILTALLTLAVIYLLNRFGVGKAFGLYPKPDLELLVGPVEITGRIPA